MRNELVRRAGMSSVHLSECLQVPGQRLHSAFRFSSAFLFFHFPFSHKYIVFFSAFLFSAFPLFPQSIINQSLLSHHLLSQLSLASLPLLCLLCVSPPFVSIPLLYLFYVPPSFVSLPLSETHRCDRLHSPIQIPQLKRMNTHCFPIASLSQINPLQILCSAIT